MLALQILDRIRYIEKNSSIKRPFCILYVQRKCLNIIFINNNISINYNNN